MELNQKLQELRKQRGLTQEELANRLYVSRTAVSKWESGKGYPSLDSLKAIASFFQVTVDELLSNNELLTLAQQDTKQKESHLKDLAFGLSDCGSIALLFLPFFRQTINGVVQAVSLLVFSPTSPWLQVIYLAMVVATVILGLATLALQNYGGHWWLHTKRILSVLCNVVAILLLIVGSQPYAAAFLLLFLVIKIFLGFKCS